MHKILLWRIKLRTFLINGWTVFEALLLGGGWSLGSGCCQKGYLGIVCKEARKGGLWNGQ